MNNRKREKSFFHFFIKTFLGVFILFVLIFSILHIFRTDVIRYGGKALGYTVSVEEARLFYQEGSVGIRMEALTIKELTGVVSSFQTDELRLRLSPILTTFFKDFHIAEFSLRRPHLVLAFPEKETVEVKEKAGEVKKEEIPSPTKPLLPLEIRKTIIEDGQVTIKFLSDKGKTEKPAETIFPVKNISLLASAIQSPTEKVGLRIKADRLSCSTLGGEMTAEGSIDIFCDETLAYTFNINTNELHLEQIIQTFYPELANIKGEATVEGSVKSNGNEATNVRINKISLTSLGGKIEAKGKLNVLADETVDYDFDVHGDQLSLEQITETFYPELTGLQGEATVEGTVKSAEQETTNVQLDKLSATTFGGRIEAQGVLNVLADDTVAYSFDVKGDQLSLEQITKAFYPELTGLQGEATVEGTVKSAEQETTNVQLDKLSATAFGGKIGAKGVLNVLADETVAYNFDVKGGQLSLGQLAETFYPELTGLKGEGTVEGHIKSGEQGAIDIQLTNLFLSAFEGELNARGKLNFPPDGAPVYSLDFDTKNLRIEQINRALKVESDEITGATTLAGHIENSGKTEPAVTGLNGQVSFSLNNGTVKQFGILGKIFNILSPAAYLKGEIPDLSAKGFHYSSITGALAIKDGVGNLDETVLKSASWNIMTKGDLDFVKEEMDLDIYIQMIQTVDTVVSWIPVVGHILKDKNRGLLDIYFKAKGKMNDPQVEYKPITNLADQVWGILKRTLTLPLQLIPEKKPAPAPDAPQ